jgi:hypothetical protein
LEITDPPVVEQKSGNAPATIAADRVLEVKVPGTGKLTFAGPTGKLWLDRPSTFTGKVADFGAQESIDLPNIPVGLRTTLGYSVNSSDTGGIFVGQGWNPHRENCAPRKLHGYEFHRRSRWLRRHAHHGSGANGEPVSAVDHTAHGMMSLSGSPLGH